MEVNALLNDPINYLKTISKNPLFFKKTNKPIIKQKIKDYLISSAIK